MDLREQLVGVVEGDEMASYGLPPEVDEHLQRAANPALYEPPAAVAETHARVRSTMRARIHPAVEDGGLTLSA